MSAPAEVAVRAWVNGRTDLTGGATGSATAGTGPLGLGAFLRSQESPASGAYAILAASPALGASPVAEDGRVSVSRITALIFGGTAESAEIAAVAYTNAVRSLSGAPVPCGDTGVTVLVTDNVSEPSFQPAGATGGEQYCFVSAADFVLFQ